jgi:tetratricopeptide (TPR) repeat protein
MTKFYLAIFALIIFAGCKSAGKAYQKGDYADAIELGIKKLQKDPHDTELIEIVKNSYTYAVGQHENQVRILQNSKNENRYERIFQQYLKMQDLYQQIHQYPVAARMIQPTDYSSYVETYREKAAELHLERADHLLGIGNKTALREAYHELNKALRFTNHRQIKYKRDSVYDAALTKVVIIPMQQFGGGYQHSSSFQFQNFQNEILRTLSANRSNDFTRFYSEWDARSQNIEPDQFLELNMNRIMLGRPIDRRSSREVSKEVVVKEIVHKPDSVVKQYGTVRARINTTQRTILSEADLIITLRDRQGRIIWNDRFTGQHQWRTEFSSYTGDERALSSNDKNLINQREENMPAEDWVLDQLFRQIQQDLSARLRGFYGRNR